MCFIRFPKWTPTRLKGSGAASKWLQTRPPTNCAHLMPPHNIRNVRSYITACALAASALSTGCGGGGTELDAQPTNTTNSIATPSYATTKDVQYVAAAGIVLTAASAEWTESPVVLASVQQTEPPVPAPATSTSTSTAASGEAVAPTSAVHPVAGALGARQPLLVSPTAAVALAVNPNSAASLADWVELAQPATNDLPADLFNSVAASNIIAFASPKYLFPHRNIGLQCQGANATLADVPALAQQVETTHSAQKVQRFGTAGSAANPVFRVELGATDVLAAGTSPRCEVMAYPMPGSALPVNQTFWLSVSMWVDDWRGANDELIIEQMHIQDPRKIVLNPFLALVVRGNELRVELRHNPHQTPSQATTSVVSTTRVALPTRRWFTAVIQAKLSQDTTQAPFFKLWLDDTQVVDYRGAWGYVLQPDAAAYAKVGLYHWLHGNAWDTTFPTRSMMLGSMLLARDSAVGSARSDLITAVALPNQ